MSPPDDDTRVLLLQVVAELRALRRLLGTMFLVAAGFVALRAAAGLLVR